ncbi:MAG: spore germination lipoprotein GerD [Sporolactobacillus sp.]
MRRSVLAVTLMLLLVLFGCGSNAQSNPSYGESKKMVIDVLKTDDGKKALQSILTEKEFRSQMLISDEIVKNAVLETLASEAGRQSWEKLMDKPDFMTKLAQLAESKNRALLKQLMSDPDYQKMLMDVLSAPKLQEQYLTLLRTENFRKQIQNDLQDAIAAPDFRKKLSDTISEMLKKQGGK